MNRTCAVVTTLVGLACSASAEIVEFTFVGNIDSLGGSVSAPFDIGDSLEVQYRFDTNAVDSDSVDTVGTYTGAMRSPSLRIGAWSWSESVAGDLGVLDNGFAGDSYGATIQQPLLWFAVSLTNFGGDALVSDALPSDLDFDEWQARSFAVEMLVGPAYWNAGGTLTGFSSRIVPVPGTASIGLVVGLAMTRRRR